MKKIIFITCLMVSMLARGQEFTFQMYFEDSQGNRDTIIIGYDINGSRDSIMPLFNEINIKDQPYNSELDVRITNQADINMGSYDYPLFHAKSKIIRYYCSLGGLWFTELPYVNIDILTKNWPVTVSWDKTKFQEDCLSGSVFTPYYPGFWWDSGMKYSDFGRTEVAEVDQLVFKENFPANWIDFPTDPDYFNYYTLDTLEVPVSTFRFGFGDPSLLSLNVENKKSRTNFEFFPNPTKGRLYIRDISTADVSSLYLIERAFAFDCAGKRYERMIKSDGIDLSDLNNGIYVINIILSDGSIISKKILKIN